jgi:mannose-6-phosphate isomerase-like protein (cupin superfamily)
MRILKEKAIKKKISNNFIVWEYEMPTNDYSVASAYINTRYPEAGYVSNLDSDMVYFVKNGSGVLFMEGREELLKKDTVLQILKGVSYAVLGKDLEVVILSVPKWNPEMHQVFDAGDVS